MNDASTKSERSTPGLNRRAAGAALAGAAAGVVGSAVLAARGAHPGPDARVELTAAEETTASVKGMVAPVVVTLRDTPTITVNAALGNDFRVTLGGNRAFASPTGGMDGQRITLMITQGKSAPHKVTWSGRYKFGTLGSPALSAAEGHTDVLGFIYHKSLGAWLCVGAARGF